MSAVRESTTAGSESTRAGTAPTSADPAPAGARTAAALIDMLPVLALLVGALVMWRVTRWSWWAPLVPVAATVGWIGVLWWCAARDGRTVGKRALGLAVVTERSGAVPTPAAALGRLVVRGALSLATVGIAGLSYRWDPAGRQRTWWDRAMGTAVISGGAGVLSEDEAIARWAPDDDAASPSRADPDGSAAPATAGGWVPSTSPGAAGTPAGPAPTSWVPPVPSGTGGGGAEFLAPPLIGGDFRAVPGGPANVAGAGAAATAGDGAAGPAASGPRLITGVGTTSGRPDPASTIRIPRAEVTLIWDTGRHVTVTGRVLIGREPAPADGEQVDHLLPVTADSVGASKTHLHLDVGPDAVSVTDRRSTNGVRVVRADGSVHTCAPGEPMPVRPGDVVYFGGRRVTIGG